jgi:hypothetical protein
VVGRDDHVLERVRAAVGQVVDDHRPRAEGPVTPDVAVDLIRLGDEQILVAAEVGEGHPLGAVEAR